MRFATPHCSKSWLLLLLILCITVQTFMMNGFYFIHRYNNIGTYYLSAIAHIDPSFFKNSIFAQALQRDNLRISLLFDAAHLVLNSSNFELFGFIQGFISMFFCTWGIFSLTLTLFKSIRISCIAAFLYTVKLNDWTLGSPAPFLNFFHHSLPYSYPLIIWSLVFFFRKRYPLALLFAGISWNFHPMCTLFPLVAYGLFFIIRHREFSRASVFWSGILFLTSAGQGIAKTVTQISGPQGSGSLWLEGVYWNTWYTCFPFTWPLPWYLRAGSFLVLFLLCFKQVPAGRMRRDIGIILTAVALMCMIGTVFADIIPVPVVIKMSLWRSTFLYLVIALPCIAYVLAMLLRQGACGGFCATLLAFFLTGYAPFLPDYYLPFLVCMIAYRMYEQKITETIPPLAGRFAVVAAFFLAAPVLVQIFIHAGSPLRPALFILCLALVFASGSAIRNRYALHYRPTIIAVLLVLTFDTAMLIIGGGIPFYYKGFYKGSLDPWADIQMQAERLSDKDALFVVPPYLNDFCNYSNRATLSDWAEGANIMYLDNRFAKEWFERMHSLGWTKRFNAKQGFNSLSTEAVFAAAQKYGARYVVTEKPKSFSLPKIYENSHYILYQCTIPDQPLAPDTDGALL